MTSVIARSMRRLSLHAHDCLDVHGKIDQKKEDKTQREWLRKMMDENINEII